MLFLKIVGAVLLCFFLILLFVLLLNVDIIINANNGGINFLIRILGKEIKPKKSAKKKKENKVFKLLGISEIENSTAFKTALKTNGTLETFKGLLNRVLDILGRVAEAVKHLKILKLNVKFIAGGENAALLYGSACAFIYPTVSAIANTVKTKKDAVNTEINCDFFAEENVFSLNIILRLRVIFGVLAAVKILLDARKGKANG